MSAKTYCDGLALYNAAVNDGDMKTAMQVLTDIVGHQRNAAQVVQATRILNQMPADAQLYTVQRSVSNLEQELKERYGDKTPDLKIDEELAERFKSAEDQTGVGHKSYGTFTEASVSRCHPVLSTSGTHGGIWRCWGIHEPMCATYWAMHSLPRWSA